jgi:hypothetical protein
MKSKSRWTPIALALALASVDGILESMRFGRDAEGFGRHA